ncbi:DUF1659 domain-containing protein [Psychrobacillus antarcticus]|uniref:DUF1659 domain-containing protein n=1 Tax=Psychrobacillus antarcticus TaxID=2879115 RepID=UPI0024083249|nr:DUF1659 domain-containing protein [Psychrobacillus antarcticus]
MANLEYKHAVLRLIFEGEVTEDGKMITKSKSYRNVRANVTADQLASFAATISSFSERSYIGAEKLETMQVI